MLSVTNPLTNTFKPYAVSSSTNQSQANQQQQMNQPGGMSMYQTTNNMPLYNVYGLHGYIAQQQQQHSLLSVDPQQNAYSGNGDSTAASTRNDDKDTISYNVQALLNGTALHLANAQVGLLHGGSGGSKPSSGPLSSGSMTSSGDQARSTPSINSECSNSMGSGLNGTNNDSTPSGGSSAETDMTGSTKKRTHSGQKVGDRDKDTAYWEKRRKNNESARRSREARRTKEEQIAMRVVYLEQENLQLRTEVSLLRGEIDKLRCMLYNV